MLILFNFISNSIYLNCIIKQTRDIVKDATGVDMADIMKANTIDAKVNKNVNVNGDVENTNVNV